MLFLLVALKIVYILPAICVMSSLQGCNKLEWKLFIIFMGLMDFFLRFGYGKKVMVK